MSDFETFWTEKIVKIAILFFKFVNNYQFGHVREPEIYQNSNF